jgi:hypothetical protein
MELEVNNVIFPSPRGSSLLNGWNRFLGRNCNTAALIKLDNKILKCPYLVPWESLVDELETGNLVRMSSSEQKVDQCLQLHGSKILRSVDTLNDGEAARFRKLSDVMMPIVSNSDLLFNRLMRANVFEDAAEKNSVHIMTIRRLYYRYFFFGCDKRAFIPDYTKRGGPQCRSDKFRGKPNKDNQRVLFKDVKSLLFKVADQDYLRGGKSFDRTYQDMLLLHFDSLTAVPSEDQLRYAIRLLKRQNRTRITANDRLTRASATVKTTGSSRDNVPGPGFIFEIDSTNLQIYAVSRFGRRRVVGQPVLYLVVDVWSGCIVGFTVSLQPPSYDMMLSTLVCCARDKNDVCREIGINLKPGEWPCNHLPLILRSDRGSEYTSDKAEPIASFGIELAMAPSMRPDRKGVVEGKLGELKNIDQFELLPGRHKKNPKRRDPDGKKKAALTIDEIKKIIGLYILEINRRPPEEAPYELDFNTISRMTRSDMFKWGIENRSGYTQERDFTWIVRNLMKRDFAKVTAKGISFRGMLYLSTRMAELGYFNKAKPGRSYDISIYIDENRAWEIYTFSKDDELMAAMIKSPEAKMNHPTFAEMWAYRKDKEALDKATKRETARDTYEGRKKIAEITKNAKKQLKEEAQEEKAHPSKQNIRANRYDEINLIEAPENIKRRSIPDENLKPQEGNEIDSAAEISLKIFKNRATDIV